MRAMMDEIAPSVVFFSLEPLRRGQASATHVDAIAEGLLAEGLKVTRVTRTLEVGEQENRLTWLFACLRMTVTAIIALFRHDMLYVRSHPLAILAVAAAWVMGKPVIHEINGLMMDLGVTYRLPKWLVRLFSAMQLWQYRKAAALIAVTDGLAAWIASHPGLAGTVHIVTNGVDTTLFHPDAVGGPAIDGRYVLFFGGLVAWHGIPTMLKATQDPAWPAHMRLVIAGEGRTQHLPGQDEARHLILTGHLERTELAGLAARACAILCPIETHGGRGVSGVAPLKLFEGMASARPVIVTDLPFQSDVVRQNACGVVIPPANSAALAAAVADMAANPDKAEAMGRNGRAAALRAFDWHDKARETASILRTIAARRGQG